MTYDPVQRLYETTLAALARREANPLIPVVCTQRGTHEPVELSMETEAKAVGATRYGRVVFRCPQCGRNPKRRLEDWAAAFAKAQAADLERLDISYLPF